MCGPPDFAALGTCAIHLAELSAAGLATYSVCKATSLCRELARERPEQEESALRNGRGRPVAEGLGGHSNA